MYSRNTAIIIFLMVAYVMIGKDLQDIKEIGVDHAILNFNRPLIRYNIDNIIDVSKRLCHFIM
jgi:hypothetical protein